MPASFRFERGCTGQSKRRAPADSARLIVRCGNHGRNGRASRIPGSLPYEIPAPPEYSCRLRGGICMMKHTLAVVAVGVMCSVAVGEAHVTRIEVLKVEQVPAAQADGQAVPAYERMSGRFYGELDPRD